MVVVTPEHQRAYQLYEDVAFFCGVDAQHASSRIAYYAADEVLPYSEMLPDRSAMQSRLSGILQLHHRDAPVLVMPAAAMIRRVLPKPILSEASDLIELAEEVDRDTLLQHLIRAGYQRVSVVEDRGTFSVRGAILDIFSPLYAFPARIELDDQLVTSIRFFEPTTQRKIADTDDLLIGPVDELLCTPETLAKARRRFADIADQLHYSTRDTRQLLDDIAQGVRPFGAQGVIPGFYDQMVSLFDYLPPDTLVIFDEPHEIQIEARLYSQRMEEAYALAIAEGRFAFPPEEFLFPSHAWDDALRGVCRIEHQAVTLLSEASSASSVDAEWPEPDASPAEPLEAIQTQEKEKKEAIKQEIVGVVELPFVSLSQLGLKQQLRSIPATQEHRLQPLAERIRFWRMEGLRVAIACGTKGQSIRLKELLALYDLQAKIEEEPFSFVGYEKKPADTLDVTIFLGRIAEGFLFPRERVAFLSEEEIFGPKAKRRKAAKKTALLETELQSLREGDKVIHREHGLAEYGGLHTLDIAGVKGDFLLLEFFGRDKLYLPITKLAQIERYTGGGTPTLDRLKGSTFEKKKSKARSAIQAIAGDLLKLYASRQAHLGEPIAIPAELYAEFEARFPYEETNDQARAIQDVLDDMRSARCMDRLVCGDVGYGKTEVAIRAAFVAAFSGRQVAVLVPTTVLAQQHGLNFTERFEGYPVKIAVLSRFQSKKEQSDTLKDLAQGKVDIIIGTHRLLSRDVHFKNLGLLIVDEEQRFGVKHKEKVKQLQQSVDALTLTATPIPRTLEMAMVGARDLSLIRTPPHDRLAIRTAVAPRSDEAVREAMMRELNRGGQVFFVHNRVEDIGKIQAWLHEIVPEARSIIAHGQMPEDQLERVMLDFVQGRYNVLLCTSIIESGLDIPRANTIIVNRADTFGLAQLYQIRGRVGRGKERAYALLLVPAEARINPEAKQRLTTLQRFTELGAGFEIARHDLEMRGAGNLLGQEQSGHIHAIGLDLYLEMLQEAVAELQGRPPETHVDPEVKLGLDAYLPEYYIPDVQLRLQCYRRLSLAVDEEELDQISVEFEDRFGTRPREVDLLFQMMEIRLMLKRIYALSGEMTGKNFRIFFHPQAPLDHEKLMRHAQRPVPLFRLLPQHVIESYEPLKDGSERLAAVRAFLRELPSLILPD
jgi:transcription-repair coupling factor (superfamily II helicase)